MMGHLVLWILALAAGYAQAASIPACCKEKSVGGVAYMLVEEADTAKYGCKSDCVFQRADSPGSRFCFKDGDLEVVCDGEGGEGTAVLGLVKSYIDSNTCLAVSYGNYSDSLCRDSAKSFYKEFIYKGKRVIVSNNIPDHPAEHDALVLSQVGNSILYRCPGWQFVQLPVDPEKKAATGQTDAGKGAVGFAVTGGVFFSQFAGMGTELALTNEGGSLDSCMGHSAPTGMPGGMGPPDGMAPPSGGMGPPQSSGPGILTAGSYHYHGNLNCSNAGAATGANDPTQCKLIGYYRDGVPVYGFCRDKAGQLMTSCYKIDPAAALVTVTSVTGVYVGALNSQSYSYQPGQGGCNLDEASGAIHPLTGKYSYFMTTGYPWIPPKFAGSMGVANACSAEK